MSDTTGRILGIDYGSKRIGVAISDPMGILSQGVGTLDNDERTIERLAELVRERNVVRMVVGMPYSEDGGKGPKALEVESFIQRVKEGIDVEVITWDESLSSVDAQRAFIAAGMPRKKRQQKGRVDEMAARLLLQEYLDHRDGGR